MVSFYKIFGFPTGLGALIMTRQAAERLSCTYFGGGMIEVCDAKSSYKRIQKSLTDRFEPGTLHFLGIVAVQHGLRQVRKQGMLAIKEHTFRLAQRLYVSLKGLKHLNGRQVCEFYGEHESGDIDLQGPIVTFNALDDSGAYISHKEVSRLASLCNIQIRTGVFCNPGAGQKYLGTTLEDLKNSQGKFSEGGCWEELGLLESGKPTGKCSATLCGERY